MTASEINNATARFYLQLGVRDVPKAQIVNLSDEQLNRIRARLRELSAQWHALAPDAIMELRFELNRG